MAPELPRKLLGPRTRSVNENQNSYTRDPVHRTRSFPLASEEAPTTKRFFWPWPAAASLPSGRSRSVPSSANMAHLLQKVVRITSGPGKAPTDWAASIVEEMTPEEYDMLQKLLTPEELQRLDAEASEAKTFKYPLLRELKDVDYSDDLDGLTKDVKSVIMERMLARNLPVDEFNKRDPAVFRPKQ